MFSNPRGLDGVGPSNEITNPLFSLSRFPRNIVRLNGIIVIFAYFHASAVGKSQIRLFPFPPPKHGACLRPRPPMWLDLHGPSVI